MIRTGERRKGPALRWAGVLCAFLPLPTDELTPPVQEAARRGLDWLVRHQDPDGSWRGAVGFKSRQDYNVRSDDVPHVGVTALSGIALLAAGNLPGRGPHGDALRRAVDYLLDQVNDFGFISAHQTRMYSHAFATLFLAEVYGMMQEERLEPNLQKAVDLIIRCQNEDGAWRYEPFVWQSDMSVTVCQLMALRAARNAGIHVPEGTIHRAVKYVEDSLVEDSDSDRGYRQRDANYYRSMPGAFRYQVYGDERSSFALTAAGVTSLLHAAHYDHATLRRSLGVLEEVQKLVSEHWVGHFFYFYGHYYAVQAMFISSTGPTGNADYWQRYWTRTSEELLRHQQEDGRWQNPIGPGDAFGTAVACIVLQTPNRYLPILQR